MNSLPRFNKKDNSKRKHVPEQLKAMRKKQAEERQEVYNKLTLEEKLKRLEGFAAKKQRARLVLPLP